MRFPEAPPLGWPRWRNAGRRRRRGGSGGGGGGACPRRGRRRAGRPGRRRLRGGGGGGGARGAAGVAVRVAVRRRRPRRAAGDGHGCDAVRRRDGEGQRRVAAALQALAAGGGEAERGAGPAAGRARGAAAAAGAASERAFSRESLPRRCRGSVSHSRLHSRLLMMRRPAPAAPLLSPPQNDPLSMVGNFFGGIPGLFAWVRGQAYPQSTALSAVINTCARSVQPCLPRLTSTRVRRACPAPCSLAAGSPWPGSRRRSPRRRSRRRRRGLRRARGG